MTKPAKRRLLAALAMFAAPTMAQAQVADPAMLATGCQRNFVFAAAVLAAK